MADDESAFIPSPNADREVRRANRAVRRQQMREEAAPPPADIEPEPDPTLCNWCGFVAFFETETPDEEKAKCPACRQPFATAPMGGLADPEMGEDDKRAVDVCLRMRQAFALDRIAGVLQEAWDEACDRLGIS